MYRRRHQFLLPRAAIAILALFLIASGFGSGSVATAQQAATYPMTVTQNRVPGASGQVTIMPMGGNQLMVTINIKGLPPSPSSRAAHIHTAPGAVCDNGAPVTYPLSDVAVDGSGNGTSTSTITLTPDKPIMANNAYVNVHEQAMPPGNGVICANITDTYTASGTVAVTSTVTSSGPAAPGEAGAAVSTGTLGLGLPASPSTGATTSAPATTVTTVTTTPTGATTTTSAAGPAPTSPSPSGPRPTGPNGCWLYDSWCMYCSTHAGSDICTKYPPNASVNDTPWLAISPAPPIADGTPLEPAFDGALRGSVAAP